MSRARLTTPPRPHCPPRPHTSPGLLLFTYIALRNERHAPQHTSRPREFLQVNKKPSTTRTTLACPWGIECDSRNGHHRTLGSNSSILVPNIRHSQGCHVRRPFIVSPDCTRTSNTVHGPLHETSHHSTSQVLEPQLPQRRRTQDFYIARNKPVCSWNARCRTTPYHKLKLTHRPRNTQAALLGYT